MYNCKRYSCKYNKDGKCTLEDPECDKDLFVCKACGYKEWMNNPLERKRCPNCNKRNWDQENMRCPHCGHTWRRKTDVPKRCPKCGKELVKI